MTRSPTPRLASLPAGGVYVALFVLRRPRRILVGRLGFIAFQPGTYAYVGSAQRSLQARLDRHGLRRKPLRWHIDYLSTRAEMLGAIVIEGPKSLECRLAAMLAKNGAESVPGFGCSDCRCGAHLVRLSHKQDVSQKHNRPGRAFPIGPAGA